ncbi:TraX family protein [Eubacterium oxidoreducens]|uniref:TraX protein n=1 Tax=Eubacterium oxidoreducens TaxID=1732 RepID=A0A1G6CL78_EUBOX|nr:TraX family protein [Eubacterium oxidoreducens]SDB33644.1 TraX protein [Eubacterium oxidoreducens]
MNWLLQGQVYKGKRFQGFSASVLKLFAIICMLLDHIGASYIEEGIYSISDTLSQQQLEHWIMLDSMLRIIGRVTFPIMAFFIVEGLFKTRNVRNYILRLGVFAFISEIPFDLAIENSLLDFEHQNIFFTLVIGLMAIAIAQKLSQELFLARLVPIVIAMIVAYALKTDYGAEGIAVIALMYAFYQIRLSKEAIGAIYIATEIARPQIAVGSAIYAVLMFFYNGKRGFNMKYLFYVFYPAHLLILGMILRVKF